METGVDAEARAEDELTTGLEDVINTAEDIEIHVQGNKMDSVVGHEPLNPHVEHTTPAMSHNTITQDTMDHNTMGHNTITHDTVSHDTMGHDTMGHDTMGHDTMGHDTIGHDTMGHDMDPDANAREPEAMEEDHISGDKGDDKNYREGPWDVLEMLVLVSAMKEYAETVGSHAQGAEAEVHEQHKWHSIEDYCWGQLVQRSVSDCHEKWMSLSGEFRRIKEFESTMLQDPKSYWEMTFEERSGSGLPSDFSQEVYNALWQWDDRDRIGEPVTSQILVDEVNIKGHSLLRSMGRSRKRTSDRGEIQVPRKSSRGEASMESSYLGSQLMMFGTQQVGVGGEGIGALAEVPEEIQPSEDDEVWNAQFAQLRVNQQFWAPHGRASATWAFYVVNDNSEPDSAHPQQMRCAICHPAQQEHRPNSATRVRKGVVTYNKQHGTTSMKKHVAQEHGDIFTKYKATRKPTVMTRAEGHQHPRRMKKDPSPSLLTDFISTPNSSKKSDPAQERLLEDLVLYVAKGNHPMSMVDNIWLRRLVMRQCGRVNFPAGRQLADEIIPRMVTQTMEKHVLPVLAGCVTATASFDVWSLRRGVNTVALVIHFINAAWVPCRVTVGVFEAPDVASAALAMEVKELLNSFNLTDKIIAFVMDDDSRLGSLTTALSSMVLCAPLQLSEPYSGTCFGHVMAKACEYATNDQKVCSSMREVSIDAAMTTLKKTISWTTRSETRRLEWLKACVDVGLPPRKLRTPLKGRFAAKVVLFQEALHYQHAFSLCYAHQINDLLEVPNLGTWAIAKTITDALSPVLQQCVLSQSKGYWLLSDALATALGLCIQLHKDQIERGLASPKLDVGNFESELEVLQARMMSEVINALAPFLSFTVTYSPKHAHNMLALMLDPRYKGLSLVKDYVGRERALQVVSETDTNALLPCLVTVFKQLNPASVGNAPALSPTAKDSFDENSLFGSTASNDEAIVGHLKAELSLFRRLHIDPKDCENPLAWWKDREVQFPNVGFLARQILGIVGTQVETERIFSVVGLITTLRRRHIGPENLKKLALIRENWPEDPRAGRKIVESGLEGFLLGEENVLVDNEDLAMESGLLDE